MPRRKSIQTLLKSLEAEELREVIRELVKLSKQNRQFVELYLQSSDEVDLTEVLEEAKKNVRASLRGHGQFPKLDLRGARKVVTEYGRLLKDYPRQAADLKLYYVEQGTEITSEFGDLYGPFYDSMGSMFERFCGDLSGHRAWYDGFADRIAALLEAASQMGWGYYDDLHGQVMKLKQSFAAQRKKDAGW